MVKCKYCQSDISEKAKVCPVCRRNLNPANNPLWLIPIIFLICLFTYFILSPNAPVKVREAVCGLGIREGYPYCYKIEIPNFDLDY